MCGLYATVDCLVRISLSLVAKKTLVLLVFSDFVWYPSAKTVVPQRTVVVLNPLPHLRKHAPPCLAGWLQICWRWMQDVICCWLACRCSCGTWSCSDSHQPKPVAQSKWYLSSSLLLYHLIRAELLCSWCWVCAMLWIRWLSCCSKARMLEHTVS